MAERISRSARAGAWIFAAVWIVGALIVWNTVFDSHIVRGARDYVERQQAFTEGRGPRQDMRRAMASTRADGARAAWAWTSLELVPGIGLGLWYWRRRPAGRQAPR